MGEIISSQNIAQTAQQLFKDNKRIVLVGGCFDILHTGHIRFLEKAKEVGDVLMVLLENDANIKQAKGPERPINNQQDRATVLSTMRSVDYVLLLPYMRDNAAYDAMISEIKPAILATTATDPHRMHKERQAKQLGSTVIDVIQPIKDQSTSRIAALVEKDF